MQVQGEEYAILLNSTSSKKQLNLNMGVKSSSRSPYLLQLSHTPHFRLTPSGCAARKGRYSKLALTNVRPFLFDPDTELYDGSEHHHYFALPTLDTP